MNVTDLLWSVGLTYLVFYCSTALHEMGHWAVGRKTGTISEIQIGDGPLLFTWGIARFKLYPWGGHVLWEPSGDSKTIRAWQYMAVSGAGPLVNLLLFVTLGWLGYAEPDGQVRNALFAGAWLNLAYTLLNLRPLSGQDGAYVAMTAAYLMDKERPIRTVLQRSQGLLALMEWPIVLATLIPILYLKG